MKFVFDSNSLIAGAGSRNGLLPAELRLHVPLTALQELLYQLSRPAAEGRARKAIIALEAHPKLVLDPSFGDLVRTSFGDPPVTWPVEVETWREVVREVSAGAGWTLARRAWNDLWIEGNTTMPARQFVLMKQNNRDFETSYLEMIALLKPGLREEIQERTSGLPRPQAQRARRLLDERHLGLARLMAMTEIAALGGVEDAMRTLDRMMESDAPDAGQLRVQLGNRLAVAYRGGLEFVIATIAASMVKNLHGATQPDKNDPFDLWILASVDDDPQTFFVTEERRWHAAAEVAGMPGRVIRWRDLNWLGP